MWDALMDQTVTIKRNTTTQDGGGGAVRTLATTLSNVRASVQTAGSTEVYSWNRRGVECDDVVYCIADLDTLLSGGLQNGDVIVDSSGVNRAVTGVRKEKNTIISADPLYEIATVWSIPPT